MAPSSSNKEITTPPEDRSTQNSEKPAFLVVGRLRRPHGLEGGMLMEVITDYPERLQPDRQPEKKKTVYVGDGRQPIEIVQIRWHNQAMIVHLDGMDHRDQVDHLRNQLVYVQTSDLPDLPEDEYYHHQLLGLSVIDNDTGDALGHLKQILETGANDVYVVETDDGTELLLPAIEGIVIEIDLDKGWIIVRQPEWL